MWCIINNSLPSHMLSRRPKAKRKRLTMWNACETYMYMKAHVQIFFSVIPSNSILLNIFTHFLCHLKMHIHLLFDTSPPQSEFHKCVKMFIPWIKKKTLQAMCKMFFFCHNVFNWVWLCIHVDYLQVYAITVINFYFYLLMYCIKVSIHIIWHK